MADDLTTFAWDDVYEILQKTSPVILQILLAATQTRTPRKNRKAIIGVCVSILLNFRFNQLNLFQKIIGIILHSGHCSKQVLTLYFYQQYNILLCIDRFIPDFRLLDFVYHILL